MTFFEVNVIIDAHTHIFPDEVRKDREGFCAKDQGFAAIYKNPKARMAGVEELISSMDGAGVEKSVVCGFSWSDPGLCALHNRYLLESAAKHSHRLIVFLSLLMTNPDRSLVELEQGLKGGARGVGEIAFYHHEMTSQDIDAMKPVLTLMEKRGIPLLLHTNEILGHPYPGKGMTPLEPVLRNHSCLPPSSHPAGSLGRRSPVLRIDAGGCEGNAQCLLRYRGLSFSLFKKHLCHRVSNRRSGEDSLRVGLPVDSTAEIPSGGEGIRFAREGPGEDPGP